MPFTSKKRCCSKFTGSRTFAPVDKDPDRLETLEIGLDEIEAIRICDGERLSQAAAARRMEVSTGTVQRLLYAGRRKMIEAVCCGKVLKVVKPDNITIKRRIKANEYSR